jgi:serine/alanine adding enzyme
VGDVIEATSTAPRDWDGYVERHPQATAYHRSAAVAIGATAFDLHASYLTARDAAGGIVGVLPLVEQSSVLFGRYIISVPFFTYGGTLADDDSVACALAYQASDLARERRAAHLELRHTAPLNGLSFQERLDKVSMILPLPDSEESLAKQLGSKLRSQIKRADRESPTVHWGGRELLPEFYEVFAMSMRDLGTPVYSRRFFDVVCTALEGLLSVLVIRVSRKVQAAAIVVRHGRCVEVPWAAASAAAKTSAINMRMYWEMLKFALQTGASAFDFGRSTVGSGTYRFKAQWGAQPAQLHWHYWLPEGAPIPKLNQSNPKYALASTLWRRLPLWCANRLGPYLVRNLP